MARDKNRMAGDALEASDAGQVVAEDLSAKEEGFRNALERNIGTEEYERIGAAGHDDPTKAGEYSAKEVISEFRNRGEGVSVDDGPGSMVEKYQGMVDEGTRFNKKATEFLKMRGVSFGDGTDPVDPEPTPDDPVETTPELPSPEPPKDETDPWPFAPGAGPGIGAGGGMSQQVQQDNDINTSITGSNNTVTNNQDNSVSQSSGGRYLDDWMKKHNFFG